MTKLKKLKNYFLSLSPIIDKKEKTKTYQLIYDFNNEVGFSLKWEENRKIGVFCGRMFETKYANDWIEYAPEIGIFKSKEKCWNFFEHKISDLFETLTEEFEESDYEGAAEENELADFYLSDYETDMLKPKFWSDN